MKTSVMDVHEMLSVLSVAGVEKRITEVAGVESATVNFAAGNATVRYDETRLDIADIRSDVRQSGFESALPKVASADDGRASLGAADASPAIPASAAPQSPAVPSAAAGGASAGTAPPVDAAPPTTPDSPPATPDTAQAPPSNTAKPVTDDATVAPASDEHQHHAAMEKD